MPKRKSFKLDRVAIRMVKQPPLYSEEPLSDPETAIKVLREVFKEYDREVVCVVNLKTNMQPVNLNIVSVGAIDQAIVHPRELLKSSILSNAASVFIFHNYPSGDPAPSEPDKELTRKVVEAGDLMEIPVLDHVIVGGSTMHLYSFREHMPELFGNEAFMWSRERKTVQEPSLKYADVKKSVIKTLKAAGNREGRNMPNKKALDIPER